MNTINIINKPPPAKITELLSKLELRFTNNTIRHPDMKWKDIKIRLENAKDKLTTLCEMEATGGEPDVAGNDKNTGEYLFVDCCAESPAGRRNLCYDREAWEERKSNRPENNALDMATEIGIELLTEDQYRYLQTLVSFDIKTSSWIMTPADVRSLGGALYADRRYGRVFVYHNGAQSYYSSRGFRGMCRI